MGPKEPCFTVLSKAEDTLIVAFHTHLTLDDCLYFLQDAIPMLTGSSLHRCLQRHGISHMPDSKYKTKRRTLNHILMYFLIFISQESK